MAARKRYFSAWRFGIIGALTLTLTTGCVDVLNLLDVFDDLESSEAATSSGGSETSENVSPLVTDARQVSPSDGALVEDKKTVSGVFEVQFSSELTQNSMLRFPVSVQDLPEDFVPEDLQLERYDESSGDWIPEGILSGWDPDSHTATFEVKNPLVEPSTDALENPLSIQFLKLYKYRMRVYFFQNSVTVSKEGSAFSITYYPVSYGYRSSVKKDSDWTGSGLDEARDIPNYIEDLDQALNEAYQGLLKIKDQNGVALFKPLKTPIEVKVLDTGTDLGNSALGGPAKISATKIQNWSEMKQTVAHELVHVFQGQYYSLSGLFTGRANTWFIEASAQYFADRALGLDEVERAEFYGDGLRNIEHYLSLPITVTDAYSYYALGHFFSWASGQTRDSLIPDTLRKSQVRDSRALDAQLKDSSAFDDLGDAVNQYGQFLVTHPEYDAGLATGIKNAMRSYGRQFLDQNSTNLTKANLYASFQRDLFPLASNYLSFLSTTLDGDNLLVLAPVRQNKQLNTLIYTNPGRSSADYQAKSAINSGDSLYEKESVTVPHFGKDQSEKAVEIWINNPSLSDAMSGDFELYVLRPPQVLEVLDGSVRWDQTAIADIPPEKIKAYAVYIGKTLLKKDIPFEVGATEQILKHKDIQQQSDVRVTITDVFDHEWPVADTQNLSIRLKNITFNNGGSSPSQPDLPNIKTVSVGPKQSNVLSFDTEVLGTTNQNIKWQLAGIGTGGSGSFAKATPVLDQDMSGIGRIEQSGQNVNIILNPSLKGIQFCWVVGTSAADPAVRYLFVLELFGSL